VDTVTSLVRVLRVLTRLSLRVVPCPPSASWLLSFGTGAVLFHAPPLFAPTDQLRRVPVPRYSYQVWEIKSGSLSELRRGNDQMSSTKVRFRRRPANQVSYLSALLLISIISLGLSGCSGLVSQASNPSPLTPSITAQPTNQTVTAGQAATFVVAATGTAPLNYQWKKSGTATSGATSASYTT